MKGSSTHRVELSEGSCEKYPFYQPERNPMDNGLNKTDLKMKYDISLIKWTSVVQGGYKLSKVLDVAGR